MSEPRLKHIGADSILAERTKLLARYDIAKSQVTDDPVKVGHGNVAEEFFRNYLARFLPRKYGVTKGHIITRELTYNGPFEEWDLIVYDVSEAPVLYIRDDSGGIPLLGIPVRYVNAVIEVKATLTPNSAQKVCDKLLRLEQEPPRVCWRLQTLRTWSHEQSKTILPRGPKTGHPNGVRA